MRWGIARRARALAMTLAPLCAWQGCALIAGLEEPEPVPPGGATTGGGSGGGEGGSGAGNTGGGGSGPVDCEEPGTHLEILAQGQVVPRGITVDDLRVYWTTEGPDLGNNGVWMRDKAGGTPVRLADTGVRRPISLLVDSTHAYWSDTSTLSCPERDGILRVSHVDTPDPSNFQILDTVCGKASMIALDTTRIYYARSGSGYVQSVPKAGGSPDDLVAAPGTAQFGIAVDDSHVYWTDQTNQQVVRASKDGTIKEDLSPAFPSPKWIGLDDEFVYWTTDNFVLKHDKVALGGDPEPLHDGLADIVALAVDRAGDAIYVIDKGTGDLLKVSKTPGVAATTIVDSGDELGGVAVDGTFVYWTNTATKEVFRACK